MVAYFPLILSVARLPFGFDLTYAYRFQIERLIEKKGNSDVFLMKIDQGIEEILKFKPRNIAIRTTYGELMLHMLTGSKSRDL